MRSFLVYLLTYFIVGIANAQSPSITSTSEAVPGDIIAYQNAQVIGTAVPAAGVNITWDYTGLIDSGGYDIDSFGTPSATSYASLYPTSNLDLSIGSGGYEYFQTTSTDWSELGFISPGNDTTHFGKPLSQFHFPFSYGSIFIDSTQYISNVTGFEDTAEFIISHQTTGYGTLKVPGQSYSNVLMVKNISIQRIKYSSLFTISDTTNSIYFVTPGVHSFIMQMDFNTKSAIIDVKYVTASLTPPPTSFTFTGTGSWSTISNWSGGVVPTSPVPSGTQVTISPQKGGSCTLDEQVIFSSGSKLTVTTGAIFNIEGNLTIVK